MATERHISWNEEIRGIEVKTLFWFSAKLVAVNIIWFSVVVVVIALFVTSVIPYFQEDSESSIDSFDIFPPPGRGR